MRSSAWPVLTAGERRQCRAVLRSHGLQEAAINTIDFIVLDAISGRTVKDPQGWGELWLRPWLPPPMALLVRNRWGLWRVHPGISEELAAGFVCRGRA